MDQDSTARAVSAVIARSVHDAEYRDRFVAEPRAVLAEAGIELPADVEVTVLTASPTKTYIVVPDADLVAEELLASASGGSTAGSASTVSTVGSCLACAGTAGSAG